MCFDECVFSECTVVKTFIDFPEPMYVVEDGLGEVRIGLKFGESVSVNPQLGESAMGELRMPKFKGAWSV